MNEGEDPVGSTSCCDLLSHDYLIFFLLANAAKLDPLLWIVPPDLATNQLWRVTHLCFCPVQRRHSWRSLHESPNRQPAEEL